MPTSKIDNVDIGDSELFGPLWREKQGRARSTGSTPTCLYGLGRQPKWKDLSYYSFNPRKARSFGLGAVKDSEILVVIGKTKDIDRTK